MQTNIKNIHFFKKLTSTMDKARELAKNGAPNFTVIVSEEQLEGRGRLKRVWESKKGGLYFTVILRLEDIKIKEAPLMNFVVSLALYKTIEKLFNIKAELKWPNDILIEGEKICGILSETFLKGSKIEYLNIGIGLNVNNIPKVKDKKTTSLTNLKKEKLNLKTILNEFLCEFEKLIQNLDFKKVIKEWKEKTFFLNKKVKIITFKEEIVGTVKDIDESDGSLILKENNRKIAYGDMFLC